MSLLFQLMLKIESFDFFKIHSNLFIIMLIRNLLVNTHLNPKDIVIEDGIVTSIETQTTLSLIRIIQNIHISLMQTIECDIIHNNFRR